MSRHPAVESLLAFFRYDHLPPLLAEKSAWFHDLAHKVADLPQGPEVTTCLRKLLEANDCAVRAVLPVPAPEPEDLMRDAAATVRQAADRYAERQAERERAAREDGSGS